MTAPNPFADLEALLGESLAAKRADDEGAALRKRLKLSTLSKAEREATEALVRAWEARKEWRTVANVAVFERVYCDCGCYTEAFSHFMHRQKGRVNTSLERFIVADTLEAAMPKEVAFQNCQVPICGECAPKEGYDMEHPVKEWEVE